MNGQDVAVRQMQMADIEAVQRVDQMCFSDGWSMQTFAELFRYRTNRYFVAETSSGICGFAGISITVDTADIMKIGVLTSYRRQRIGRLLLEALVREAAENGCREILLEVRGSNEAARTLYRQAGFTEIAVRSAYYQAPVEDGLVMEKKLEPECP